MKNKTLQRLLKDLGLISLPSSVNLCAHQKPKVGRTRRGLVNLDVLPTHT